jgi:hypothetical protein|tara:strand:- start:230 stop:382 length:153 start_codon:yes stop_codon:yes gene_type:complete
LKGELFADIKLLAGDVKEVVITVPEDQKTLYMFSRTWEKMGMAQELKILE